MFKYKCFIVKLRYFIYRYTVVDILLRKWTTGYRNQHRTHERKMCATKFLHN